MLDCVLLPSGPGSVRIRSASLFADLNHPQTKAFLGCLLDADPAAQISIHGGGVAGREAVAEIRHSQPSPTEFLAAVVRCLRSLAGAPAKSAAAGRVHGSVETQPTSKKAKSSAKVLIPVGAGSDEGNSFAEGLLQTESVSDDDAASNHRGSGVVNPIHRNGTNGHRNGTSSNGISHSSASSKAATARVSLADVLLMPDRKGITRIGRNGTHATSWEVIHETPGRLRLKHPALYRRKEVCQGIERELMSVLGIDSYKTRPSTGTVLITYNKRDLRKDQVLSILDRAMARVELSPPRCRSLPWRSSPFRRFFLPRDCSSAIRRLRHLKKPTMFWFTNGVSASMCSMPSS